MPTYPLSDNFNYFFRQLNPSPSFEERAAREYATVKNLIENASDLARQLAPHSFQQGSYRQDTAIYTINDVDLVVLCDGRNPPAGKKAWERDTLFKAVASPLKADGRYHGKVRYSNTSICIKLDLSIKLEILPALLIPGTTDPTAEPFLLYRPRPAFTLFTSGQWENGYARDHQKHLSEKNASASKNFKPMIKVLKHLRSKHGVDAVSFHLECLLYALDDAVFGGRPVDYIPAVLAAIASRSAEEWYRTPLMTPCGERKIFTEREWESRRWSTFHGHVSKWAERAWKAANRIDCHRAIAGWQGLLGKTYFPATTSS